jgi:hypothetical protein
MAGWRHAVELATFVRAAQMSLRFCKTVAKRECSRQTGGHPGESLGNRSRRGK